MSKIRHVITVDSYDMDMEIIKNSFAKRINNGNEMQTEYFQGKDGYIWWHGVVEDRKDPYFLVVVVFGFLDNF